MAMIRIEDSTRDRLNEARGERTQDEFINFLLNDGVHIHTDREVVHTCGYDADKIDRIIDLLQKRPSSSPQAVRGRGRKSLDSLVLEFEQWAGNYVNGFSGLAQKYTLDHVKAFRAWLEGIDLEVE